MKEKWEEVNMNKDPIQVFILTEDDSPRDSQDDKIFPKHFKIIPIKL